jgi:hypothetical protein
LRLCETHRYQIPHNMIKTPTNLNRWFWWVSQSLNPSMK